MATLAPDQNVMARTARLSPFACFHGMTARNIIVVAASAGGLQALTTLVSGLPRHLGSAMFIVLHTGAHSPGLLPHLLSRAGSLPVCHPHNGQLIEWGRIYVAPPDHHMRLAHHAIHLDRAPKVRHTRPAADPLFQSAAEAFGSRVVGVVLTGGNFDGTAGLIAIKAHGGIGIVQDPREAEMPSMPASALRDSAPDYCLPLAEIAPMLVKLSYNPIENAGMPTRACGE